MADVVRDGNLVSSREPDDLEAFTRAVLERLATLTGVAATPQPGSPAAGEGAS